MSVQPAVCQGRFIVIVTETLDGTRLAVSAFIGPDRAVNLLAVFWWWQISLFSATGTFSLFCFYQISQGLWALHAKARQLVEYSWVLLSVRPPCLGQWAECSGHSETNWLKLQKMEMLRNPEQLSVSVNTHPSTMNLNFHFIFHNLRGGCHKSTSC